MYYTQARKRTREVSGFRPEAATWAELQKYGGTYNTVVNVRVDPLVECVDLLPELGRVEIDLLLCASEQRVETRVEEANDLRRLVADNRLELRIIDDRNSVAVRRS